jgi:acetyltransferase-like isoleucine patch superfamily enzyme
MNLFFKIIRKFLFWKTNLKKNIIKKYYTWLTKDTVASFQLPIMVNYKSVFNKNTILGKNTNFNGFEIHGTGNVIIGDNFHSGVSCKILTSFHNYESSKIPYDHTFITKDVTIGDNVWLGDNVIILGGVSLGEGVIIQAGSVVVSNIPNYAIAGGHPAKVFKYRNIEHYHQLKENKMFH